MILENPIRTKQLINELVCIWEASVRETHAFLQEKDISNLKPFVVKGVQEIQNLMIKRFITQIQLEHLFQYIINYYFIVRNIILR